MLDLTSLLAGATLASTIIGLFITIQKNRREGSSSLRQEAKEERERRIDCEKEIDELKSNIGDLELLVEKLELENNQLRGMLDNLAKENLRYKSISTAGIIASNLEHKNPEFVNVFNSSRDLWLLTSSDNNGTVLLALGQWQKIGINHADLVGMGWRKFIAPRSVTRADRVETSALDSGGRAIIWYSGKTQDGRDAEWCLRWTYGRYNGVTLAVATVIACKILP